MRKVISINIPEPCHEEWNKMTPKDKGRHCAACNKTVVDFTQQSDEQIIKSLESKGNLCGRFKTQQLDRDIVFAHKEKNNYWSIAASGLFAFMAIGNQNAYAQGEPKPVKADTLVRPMVKGKVATSVLDQQLIYGTVTDVDDKTPLPGVNILIKGTNKGVTSDFDGNYTIKVKKGDILIYSYIGYKTHEIKVGTTNQINVQFEYTDLEMLGEVVVGGMVNYSRSCYGNEVNETERFKKYKERHKNWKSRNKAHRLKSKNERIAKRQAIKNGEQERTLIGKFFYGIKRMFSNK